MVYPPFPQLNPMHSIYGIFTKRWCYLWALVTAADAAAAGVATLADTAADTAMEADSRLLWFYSFF